MSSAVDPRCLSRTQISIRIRDPGSKRHRIPDPDQQQRTLVYLTQKIVNKVSEVFWIFILISEPVFFIKNRIPDLGV
jgi:hypothetical protein